MTITIGSNALGGRANQEDCVSLECSLELKKIWKEKIGASRKVWSVLKPHLDFRLRCRSQKRPISAPVLSLGTLWTQSMIVPFIVPHIPKVEASQRYFSALRHLNQWGAAKSQLNRIRASTTSRDTVSGSADSNGSKQLARLTLEKSCLVQYFYLSSGRHSLPKYYSMHK